jgi:hypothetical protein
MVVMVAGDAWTPDTGNMMPSFTDTLLRYDGTEYRE